MDRAIRPHWAASSGPGPLLVMIGGESVLQSAQFIAERAVDVHVDEQAIARCAKDLYEGMRERKYSPGTWKSHALHPKTLDASTVDWIFTVDLLNFSFWSDDDDDDGAPFEVVYKGVAYTGYWSLCAAINRALDEGIPVTNARWWTTASTDDWMHVFRSDNSAAMPMLDERIRLLRNHGAVLLDKFGGRFATLVGRANCDAIELLNLVCCNFYSFMDVSTYDSRPVFLLKRAQILAADLWACFEGCSYGELRNIDCITMFADYRIPQQLQALQILKVSRALLDKMGARLQMNVHSKEVVELRGCSIWAVELLRRAVRDLDPSATADVNAILIDFYLWDTVKEDPVSIPFHRTRSFYY